MNKKKKSTKKLESSKVDNSTKKPILKPKKRPLKESEIREAFRTYFIQLKRKINLGPELEEIMWLHFKSAGFDDPEKFSDGTRHFGYKI